MRSLGYLSIALLTGLLALPLNAGAASSTLETLEKAQSQVKDKEYEAAIGQTKPLLDKLFLNTVEEIILAHRILGVSYCELGDHPQARNHFETLLTFSPTESINDLVSTNPCRTLFASVKNEKAGPLTKQKRRRAKKAAQPAPVQAAAQPQPPKEEPLNPGVWKRYVPFGTGQFANNENGKAWAFLTTETLAIASGVTFFLLFKNEEDNTGSFTHPDRANLYRGLVWGSIGLGTVAMSWGIIDAVLTYKKQTKKKNARLELNGPLLTLRF